MSAKEKGQKGMASRWARGANRDSYASSAACASVSVVPDSLPEAIEWFVQEEDQRYLADTHPSVPDWRVTIRLPVAHLYKLNELAGFLGWSRTGLAKKFLEIAIDSVSAGCGVTTPSLDELESFLDDLLERQDRR
jgi:hypothetical protein